MIVISSNIAIIKKILYLLLQETGVLTEIKSCFIKITFTFTIVIKRQVSKHFVMEVKHWKGINFPPLPKLKLHYARSTLRSTSTHQAKVNKFQHTKIVQ